MVLTFSYKKLSWCWQTRNPRDACRGQSRSSNMVPFDVRCGFLLVFPLEIFDFKKCREGEIRVSGHSKTSEPTQFDPPPMTSYN